MIIASVGCNTITFFISVCYLSIFVNRVSTIGTLFHSFIKDLITLCTFYLVHINFILLYITSFNYNIIRSKSSGTKTRPLKADLASAV